MSKVEGKEPAGAENKDLVTQADAGVPEIVKDYRFDSKSLEVIKANVQGDITPFDLDRIKIPSGGGLAWEIPTIGKPQMTQELDGVVIFYKNTRAYWEKEYSGEKNPPDCSSDDGIFGYGTPGGKCAACPLSKFGSSTNPKSPDSQACKNVILLFLMRPGKVLPYVVPCPPTSVGIIKKHFLRMANEGISYFRAVQRFELEKDKNNTGIEYSKLKPSVLEVLPESFTATIEEMQRGFASVFNRTGISEEDY